MKRSLGIAALVVGCSIAIAGCGTTAAQQKPPSARPSSPSTQPTSLATVAFDPAAPACSAAQLTVSGIGRISSMTGEDGFYILVANSGRACNLTGYPTISFSDGSGTLPFHYQQGGGPYFDSSLAKSVTVPAHAPRLGVQFEIAKYRCDLGIARTATKLEFRLPRSTRTITVDMRTWSGNGGIDYCKGGPKDPGQLIHVNHAQSIGWTPDYIATY